MGVRPGNTNLAVPVGRLMLLVLSLLLSCPSLAQQATVRSELSASSITRDESVTLSIIAAGVDGELDASALNKDFEVVGQSSSSQFRTVVNGKQQPVRLSIRNWTLELLPRGIGVFTVPAVSVGGSSSQALSLTVTDIPAGARRDVFVETSVDSQSPWVQSQVLMSVKVFQAVEIVDGGLSDPEGNDLQVQRIGQDSQTSEVRDGREYRVTERRFALFPQKSGNITIDPVVLSVSVPANTSSTVGFFSATRKLTRRSHAINLDVQARPSLGASWWLPASAVQLDSRWADDVSQATVGQPLTRILTLRAAGVLDSQLPDMQIPTVDGVSLYAEEPARTLGMNASGLLAEQTLKWALIPQREGELVLPELSIEWFNTDTGQSETAVLPEERIQVAPAAAASSSQSSPVTRTADSDALSGTGAVQALSSNESTVGGDSSDTANTGSDVGDASVAAPVTAVPQDGILAEGHDPSSSLGSTASPADSLGSNMTLLPNQPGSYSSSERWRLAAILMLLLWISSLAMFWWWRRRWLHGRKNGSVTGTGAASAIRQSARQTFRKLVPLADVEACCKAGELAALRTALIDWAARQWPPPSPRTLTDLCNRLPEGPARHTLAALDAALYSRASAPEAKEDLMKQLAALPAELSAAVASMAPSAVGDDHGDSDSGNDRRSHALAAL